VPRRSYKEWARVGLAEITICRSGATRERPAFFAVGPLVEEVQKEIAGKNTGGKK